MKAESKPEGDFPVMDQWAGHLRGVAPDSLTHGTCFMGAMQKLVAELELTVIGNRYHVFGPGLTMVCILSESHLALHTWPEFGYLKFDLVTCRKVFERRELLRVLRGAFEPESMVLRHVEGPLFTRGKS